MNNPEKPSFTQERSKQEIESLKEAGAEQRERLRESLEKATSERESNIDEARHEVDQAARRIERENTKEIDQGPSPAERRRRDAPISTTEREASFKMTMSEVQREMSAPSRTFSKVIHNKTVEKISDITGNTIARPNAILSGAIFAFILTLGVYIVAKNLGYPLSGFETIGSFILGWILGICYDFLKVMVTGRK